MINPKCDFLKIVVIAYILKKNYAIKHNKYSFLFENNTYICKVHGR